MFTYHTRCYTQIPITNSFTSTAAWNLHIPYNKIKIKIYLCYCQFKFLTWLQASTSLSPDNTQSAQDNSLSTESFRVWIPVTLKALDTPAGQDGLRAWGAAAPDHCRRREQGGPSEAPSQIKPSQLSDGSTNCTAVTWVVLVEGKKKLRIQIYIYIFFEIAYK